MAKSKAIEKNCPDCQARVAVASKSCKCGHTFFVERKSVRNTREKVTDQPTNDIDLSSDRRRTARLRRVRPQYYDSQEFEKKTKKKDRKEKVQKKRELTSESHAEETHTKESSIVRAPRRKNRKISESAENDICRNLPIEKQELAHIILMELNRKMNSVVWTPE